MSQDGRNWARIEGEHHSGALFDAGEGGEWDAAFVGAPMVRNAAIAPLNCIDRRLTDCRQACCLKARPWLNTAIADWMAGSVQSPHG